MNPIMRAKLVCRDVTLHHNGPEGALSQESLTFGAVYKNQYDATGLDEDNTFAKFTPSAELRMAVLNPALFGKINIGDAFYVDFTPVPDPDPVL